MFAYRAEDSRFESWTLALKCALPGLTYTNNSSKKRNSRDDFSASIEKDMDGTLKSLANPSIERDKFSAFGEMIN